MSIASTLAAWLLVLVAATLALRLSGTAVFPLDWMRTLTGAIGRPRAIALVLLALALLVLSTWKQLVQSLYIGMSGREWAVKGSVFATLAVLAVLVPVLQWVAGSRAAIAVVWQTFPWIAAGLICVKLCAGAWIAARLFDNRLLGSRALILGAVSWSLTVFALYGILRWILPEVIFHSYFLALIAILLVPLARLSAAPLALAGNRHR
jgi:hypothetical protein